MRAFWLVAISTILGCAETAHYVYVPETANAVTARRLPASRTPIPQERPEGSVEVASFGITTLPGRDDVPVLHARMIVANDGDAQPWQVDTREQMIDIAGEGRARPMYATSDVRTLPVVAIGQHERHVFDLYYPLPSTVHEASQLPRFDIQWQVATPERLVASRTTFDRIKQEPPPTYAYDPWWPYPGFGPYGWYDPFYPSAVFVHPVVVTGGWHHHHR